MDDQANVIYLKVLIAIKNRRDELRNQGFILVESNLPEELTQRVVSSLNDAFKHKNLRAHMVSVNIPGEGKVLAIRVES